MERYLSIDCFVMVGQSQKASATPRFARPKCGKLRFAQIQCDKCHQKFCPEHRFPSFRISASGLAAIKRAAASVKPSASSPTKISTAPPATKGAGSSSDTFHSNRPFSKTDRSSRQGKDSQTRAMRARAHRGEFTLPSEDEKVILATLEAERRHGPGGKGCVIM
ncbi:hypothetical protein BJV77DRAFT_982683 [Russula vinacea]|nr:hypothetical protein BJV77DRAFT_982683 [Russula vinacea]